MFSVDHYYLCECFSVSVARCILIDCASCVVATLVVTPSLATQFQFVT